MLEAFPLDHGETFGSWRHPYYTTPGQRHMRDIARCAKALKPAVRLVISKTEFLEVFVSVSKSRAASFYTY
jgi:hypothetical protein